MSTPYTCDVDHATAPEPATKPQVSGTTRKTSYHHGDLRAALVEAAYELARGGGVPAVGLREATRRVGVSARAAYRHFEHREALVLAAAMPALAALARVVETREAATVTAAGPDPAARAVAALYGVGEGYVAYALDEPGGFDIAFFGLATMTAAEDPAAAGDRGRTAYQLLLDALAGLVGVGLLARDQVPAAATVCWSAVHGFATLALRGPLRDLPRTQLDAMAAGLVRTTTAGLLGGPPDASGPESRVSSS